ncbi:Dipeptidyl-peptidase 5 [Fusarium oxysporum f. sp. albedinis]|nr:Dipeptidyl-peptidase 5 [Fusarium oxysporum f. sp. albedinis]
MDLSSPLAAKDVKVRLWISMTRFEVDAPVLACRHAGRGSRVVGPICSEPWGPRAIERQADKEDAESGGRSSWTCNLQSWVIIPCHQSHEQESS